MACSAAAAKVETLAGTGTSGTADGKGTAASFDLPYGIALTKNGGLLVGDWSNNLLRKISPEADVTTFAGNGVLASVDGNGLNASFKDLTSFTVDATDTAFVADAQGHRIRKVTSTGDVTTVAGNGTNITADGNGTAATFNMPISVAVDAAGNLYVLEYVGGVVRKIDPALNVTTLAGSSRGALPTVREPPRNSGAATTWPSMRQATSTSPTPRTIEFARSPPPGWSRHCRDGNARRHRWPRRLRDFLRSPRHRCRCGRQCLRGRFREQPVAQDHTGKGGLHARRQRGSYG